ncbi:MAG: Acyl-phosphate:glycerol-3-phosphate O-acyltransferase PlsY, partial [uncultured Campylobacterales bacterium]
AYLLAYIVGAIPFGLILVKTFTKENLLENGSKSIGATNVYRVIKISNPKLALKLSISTIILDVLKGLTPLVIAFYFFDIGHSALWMMGILSIIGHCFSPFLNFTGGKGVATALGVGVFFLPIEVGVGILVWVILAKTLKISSLSSLGGMLAFCISSFIIHSEIPYIDTHTPVVIITFIVFYQHIPNIIRLFNKEESKVV